MKTSIIGGPDVATLENFSKLGKEDTTLGGAKFYKFVSGNRTAYRETSEGFRTNDDNWAGRLNLL